VNRFENGIVKLCWRFLKIDFGEEAEGEATTLYDRQ
jgi:hypothetical protein